MSRRQHLGTVYTSYPAKDLGEKMGSTLFKCIMSVFACALWSGIFYVLAGVVNFVRANVAGQEAGSVMQVFHSNLGLALYGLGLLCTVIFVFRSHIGESNKNYAPDSARGGKI